MKLNDVEAMIERIRMRARAFKSMDNPANAIGVVSAPWGAHRKAGIKAADPANGKPVEITCYANTAAVDSQREVVLPAGGDVRSYLTVNANLFVDHRYDMEHVVAKCIRMALDPGGWLCTGQFLKGFETEYTKACIALARAGTLAMSIGFESIESGAPTADERLAYHGVEYMIRRWKALEVSYTAIPVNVTCRLVATNLEAAAELADKSRKALIEARIKPDIIQHFGIKPKRILVLGG